MSQNPSLAEKTVKSVPFSVQAYFVFNQLIQRGFCETEESFLLSFMQAQTLGIRDTPETYFMIVPSLWKRGDNRKL